MSETGQNYFFEFAEMQRWNNKCSTPIDRWNKTNPRKCHANVNSMISKSCRVADGLEKTSSEANCIIETKDTWMILLVPPSCFLLAEGDVGNNAAMRIET